MLDRIRRKKDNLVYSFIILATAVVMGFYGVGRMQSANSPEQAAAWVNGDVITRGEFSQELAYRMERYQSLLGDEKLLAALQIPQRTLQELIQNKLLAQQARKMAIIVSDVELADFIRSLPSFQRDGKFDPTLYATVPNRGIQERRERERLEISKLESYFTDRVKLTPAALDDAYQLNDAKVNVEYAKIDFLDLAKVHRPSGSEVDAFLKKTPEKELQAYYDSHKSEFIDGNSQIDKKKAPVIPPFSAVKGKVATALLNHQYQTDFAKTMQKEWDAKLAAGQSIEPELKKWKIDLKKTGPFSLAQGSIPNLGPAEPVAEAVFNLTPSNPATKSLIPFQNSFYYVKLVSFDPPKPADLPKSQEVLEKSVGTQAQTELLTDWVNTLEKSATIKIEMKFDSSQQTEVD